MRSGKYVGCASRRRLQSFATQPRHWSATSAEASNFRGCLTTAREDKQLIQMVRGNRLISAPHLCVEMIRWFGSSLSVWSFLNRLLAAGYMSRRPDGCPRLILDHRRLCRAWGRTHRKCHLRHLRQCVLTDESRFTLFQSDGSARVHCRQG